MQRILPKKTLEILTALSQEKFLKFYRSPQNYFRLAPESPKIWKNFNRQTLLYAIRSLYGKGYVTISEGLDGFTEVLISNLGMQVAAYERSLLPEAVPQEWDRKWRIVLFDIPETKRKFRESFRYHLKKRGFAEFSRSSFIYPFPCSQEIGLLAEKFELAPHVTFITAESISNEFQFKKKFDLL